jgi:hypothetical protein
MNTNTVKPEQIKSGVVVEIKFYDLEYTLFGLVINVDEKARKKFVATGKGGYTVNVLVQDRDGAFTELNRTFNNEFNKPFNKINHDQVVAVSETALNFSKLM